MNRTYLVGGVLALLVVGVMVGAAVYTGVGPAPGGDSGDDIEHFPTATDDASGSNASSPTEADPFSFAIDEVEECGDTCRDVTATLENQQTETAENVTVYTRVFAGENNTDTDDVVWEGVDEAGTIEAGETYTSTERVELTLQEGRQVENEGGWVTIVTTIETDDATVTFTTTEQLA